MNSKFRIFLFAMFVFIQVSYAQSKKSVGAARVISMIIPGVGHMYADEVSKGTKLLGIYAGALGLTIAYGPWTWEEEQQPSDPFFSDLAKGTGTPASTKVIWYASAAAAALSWIYAVADAGPAARRYNRQMGLSVVPNLKKGDYGVNLIAEIHF